MFGIEDQIRRAIEEGKFENLPGMGQPLQLGEDANEDPEWRLAHHIMKSNNFTLPWIAERQEIEAELDGARAGLARAWAWHQTALQAGRLTPAVEAEWRRAVDNFQGQVVEINRRIFIYNLQAPALQFQRPQVNAGRELEAIQSSAQVSG